MSPSHHVVQLIGKSGNSSTPSTHRPLSDMVALVTSGLPGVAESPSEPAERNQIFRLCGELITGRVIKLLDTCASCTRLSMLNVCGSCSE